VITRPGLIEARIRVTGINGAGPACARNQRLTIVALSHPPLIRVLPAFLYRRGIIAVPVQVSLPGSARASSPASPSDDRAAPDYEQAGCSLVSAADPGSDAVDPRGPPIAQTV
jgi:hypothetical protein